MSYYSPPSDPYRVTYTETPSTYQTSYSSPAYSSPTTYSSYDQSVEYADSYADYYPTTSTSSRRSPPRLEYYDDSPSSKSKSTHKKRISASGLSQYPSSTTEYRRPTSGSSKHQPRLLPPPEPERRSSKSSSKPSGQSRALVVAPRSPEITRLGTPDVGEVEHGRFCGCCPTQEEYYDVYYEEGYGKTEGQLSTAKAYISKKKGGRLLEY